MTGGRLYGYQVPPAVHRAVAESTSPGGAYNATGERHRAGGHRQVPTCGRFYPDTARHSCPVRHTERPADHATTGPGSRRRPVPHPHAPRGTGSRRGRQPASIRAPDPLCPRIASSGRRGDRPVPFQQHRESDRPTATCVGGQREAERRGHTAPGPAPRRVDRVGPGRGRGGTARRESVRARTTGPATATTGWSTSPAPVRVSRATPTPSTRPAASTRGRATPPPCGACWPLHPQPRSGGARRVRRRPALQHEGIVADRVFLFTDAPTARTPGGRRRTTTASSAPPHARRGPARRRALAARGEGVVTGLGLTHRGRPAAVIAARNE